MTAATWLFLYIKKLTHISERIAIFFCFWNIDHVLVQIQKQCYGKRFDEGEEKRKKLQWWCMLSFSSRLISMHINTHRIKPILCVSPHSLFFSLSPVTIFWRRITYSCIGHRWDMIATQYDDNGEHFFPHIAKRMRREGLSIFNVYLVLFLNGTSNCYKWPINSRKVYRKECEFFCISIPYEIHKIWCWSSYLKYMFL